MNQPLPPDVLADVAQALYAIQDPESATQASRADVVFLKRAEIETILGVLRRARVIVTRETVGTNGAAKTNRLISRQQVGDLFGLRRSATYDLTQRPDFPPPVVVSPKCLRWPVDEVVAFAEKLRHKDVAHQARAARTRRVDGNAACPSQAAGSQDGSVRRGARGCASERCCTYGGTVSEPRGNRDG